MIKTKNRDFCAGLVCIQILFSTKQVASEPLDPKKIEQANLYLLE